MINGQNVTDIIEKMKVLHINDPTIYKYWEQLILEFNDENDTISFLDSCTEEEANWISSVFDDLAHIFQSRAYADCLKRVSKKYPEIIMSLDIKIADSYIS
ncbi:hypothetical protein ACIQ1H_17035 [Lysinibacillus sp. NPDC097279]|uniref:hypothetical protein n=1 Tax=Lysinibacillus sp. NPDC097279 TaxID=3364143 RepID=UPI00381B42A9